MGTIFITFIETVLGLLHIALQRSHRLYILVVRVDDKVWIDKLIGWAELILCKCIGHHMGLQKPLHNGTESLRVASREVSVHIIAHHNCAILDSILQDVCIFVVRTCANHSLLHQLLQVGNVVRSLRVQWFIIIIPSVYSNRD